MRRINVEGPHGRISCLRGEPGSARTALVFVHGINGAAAEWSSVAGCFADRNVVAVDLRGHGESEPGPEYGAADYAADVSAAMSALDLTSAHLVGSSFGGAVCLALAAANPDRIASLTLIGGALSIAGGVDVEAAAAELRRLGTETFLAQLAPASFGPDATAEMVQELVRSAAGRDEAVVERVLRAALTSDVTAEAARVRAPALVLTGEYDQTCSPAVGSVLAAALGTECRVLAGLGHLAHIEAPRQVAALVAAHLDRVEVRGPSGTSEGS
ncbi:alpha/beta fold hydrolase [Mycolicibacterium confluentis]|uniref:Alpha/beta hydrolase n=1 Tax=Mycolicibacterium confluentis TaxID=28047 RepID=A0A7I7Y2H2_9MYCO|nr:alpha/beta hydrolase [Mycolicibacterium confluentis]MCV7320722.1 alpha/beta hydrolase [Mycolicibacterium confluentis]ORV30356.1 hypothetical protein AWB99_14830 [Mycolicibacterium confluentis]BBZ35769.1 alpha/beta hydrolase [Mycolicibacterium confluentis]